jgi:ferric-dicitrate binding protein FerR (iron transport regulator)
VTKEQLRQIIAGNASNSLGAKLVEWIKSGKMDDDLEKMIEADLQHSFSSPALSDKDLNALTEIILKSTEGLPESKKLPVTRRILNPFRIPNMIRAAAIIFFFAAVSFTIVYFNRTLTKPLDSVQLVTKENSKGRKSTLFLNDGTVINLNSESRITYPEVFGDSIREVTLEGEAFFDVAKNEQIPFVIHTDDISLTVLGTSFNVTAFHDVESIKISMNSGKVTISSYSSDSPDAKVIQLAAGESITYSKTSKTFSAIDAFDNALDFGWKDGKLVFDNAGMEDIFSRCERWYDVKFDLKNTPNFHWDYTGTFQNQTLQDVLESLSFSQNFTFRIDKNTVTVSFN